MSGTAARIRPMASADLPALKAVIAANDLFPPDMLDGMVAGHLAGGAPDEIWLTATRDQPLAVLYCAPETMTDGTWNLYLIAVHPRSQGQGHGAALIRHLETILAARNARLLLVETSGLPDFARTRDFYPRCGFAEEARIRDFYRAGDDKIVFRKSLTSTSENGRDTE